MENSEISHKWQFYKEHLRKEYPQLTNEDLKMELGKEEETLARLQEKLKKTKKEIRNWLCILG